MLISATKTMKRATAAVIAKRTNKHFANQVKAKGDNAEQVFLLLL
jgi:hypothetical protein